MRSFIGIDLSIEAKEQILEIQKQIKNKVIKGRWKYVDNFHLTLKFLDEITEVQLSEIDNKLKVIATQKSSFKLHMSELGSFPGRNGIRVLWLGLGGDLEALGELQSDIEVQLEDLGFQREKRKYTPHITIGQDLVFQGNFGQMTASVNIEKIPPIEVDKIQLFKSEQIANKRIYTPIYEYELLKNNQKQ